MQLGLQMNRFDGSVGPAAIGADVAAVARGAEAAGFASFWVMDHFFQLPFIGAAEDPMLEGYTTLAYVAGVTARIKLGTLVTGITYRHPGVLVKTATTLDVLSGGRAYLGVGAAWFDREHLGLGVPFPPLAERFERLAETLRIAHQMWSGETGAFTGAHYQLAETLCRPLPVSKPHPPILVGGSGERKTLRLVAEYGDACNLFATDLDQVRHKLGVLREHCEAVGRPYEAIRKTTIGGLPQVTRDGDGDTATPARALEFLGQLAEMGVDEHMLGTPQADDASGLDVYAERVVPEAAKLVSAGREA